MNTKRALLWGAGLLLLTGCGRLASIPYTPPTTPQEWLSIQPYTVFQLWSREIVLVQPSSTAIVYLLGLITIGIGAYILRVREAQRSRQWWGIALLLWGLGALFAGTSYQAFSYEIKCAGRDLCSWTSWWEIVYLLLSVASVDAMVAAGAYSSGAGKVRKTLVGYALANLTLYALIVLAGVITLTPFLISFELLLIVSAPGILFLFGLSVQRYLKFKQRMDLALLINWLWLGLVLGGYFVYLMLGVTEDLWARGVWFSANDVLHLGLISWMIYIAAVLAKRVKDAPTPRAVKARGRR